VINNNGGTKVAGNFTMSVSGINVLPAASFAGSEAGTTVTLNAGSYSVTEGAHDGYTMSADECSGSIANGETKTCTITNDDQTGTLNVVVEVVGGPNSAADFSLSVTGGNANGAVLSGSASGTYSIPNLNAADYLVNAAPNGTPVGYTLGSSCPVTLDNGGTKTCTMVYSYAKNTPGAFTTMSWVLHDSMTLSSLRTGAGSHADQATITFKLYGPSTEKLCLDQTDGQHPANLLGTKSITGVNADGTFDIPEGIAVSQAGTYRWVVTYSGDFFNNEVTSACGSETHTVTVGEPNQ
jgi:hypothetical protein